MATLLSHPAIPLALATGLGRSVIPIGLLLAGIAASMLPDLDVIAFRFGIPYESPFGHRGYTHSFAFAALIGSIGSIYSRALGTKPAVAFWFLFVATASHPLLDACTNGGLGVALFWPISNERFFFPWHDILVSPIGLKSFFTPYGLAVIQSELFWIWFPASLVTIVLRRGSIQSKTLR